MEHKIIETFKYLCIWISLGVSVFLIGMGLNLDNATEYMILATYVAIVCCISHFLGEHDNRNNEDD